MTYSGYLIVSRDLLLNKIAPRHEQTIAHHITYALGDVDVPYATTATVYGYATNDHILAAVVRIGDMTTQPRGYTLHTTISLNPETAKPFDSNKLIANQGVTLIDPFEIEIEPKVFK